MAQGSVLGQGPPPRLLAVLVLGGTHQKPENITFVFTENCIGSAEIVFQFFDDPPSIIHISYLTLLCYNIIGQFPLCAEIDQDSFARFFFSFKRPPKLYSLVPHLGHLLCIAQYCATWRRICKFSSEKS